MMRTDLEDVGLNYEDIFGKSGRVEVRLTFEVVLEQLSAPHLPTNCQLPVYLKD